MAGKLIDPIVKIPTKIEQGDTVTWIDEPFTDEQGSTYDATVYGLKYTLAGPFTGGLLQAAPVSFTAAVQGAGWEMTLTPTQTAALAAGLFRWQAQLTATGFELTVARGDLTVIANLANVAVGYSGLSAAQNALAQWEAALAALAGASGPPVKSYRIGTRELTYRDVKEIRDAIAFWKGKVIHERVAESLAQNQGNPRKSYVRFPSKFGSFA